MPIGRVETGVAAVVFDLSEPGDDVRGITVSLVALRWDGVKLSADDLMRKAVHAVTVVDQEYDKDVWDVKVLDLSESGQFVQLSVRANFASPEECAQISMKLKQSFQG